MVVNCYRKAGITKQSVSAHKSEHESEDEPGDSVPEASSFKVWNTLNKHGAVPDGVNQDDSLYTDDCVVCTKK